jgi:hypothetical protein
MYLVRSTFSLKKFEFGKMIEIQEIIRLIAQANSANARN